MRDFPVDQSIVLFAFNALLGILMFFLKQSYDALKQANESLRERIAKTEDELEKVRETTIRKEDFQDFRNQLWTRLDRMEVDFRSSVMELRK